LHKNAPEAEDVPDPSSAEAVQSAGWRLGNPWWAGSSDQIQYRLRGNVRRLRAYFVRSPATTAMPASRAPAAAGAPPIVLRAAWHADESIRRADPQYASELQYSVVHHTAGANDYTRAEAPAVVRGIELYHVKANGWNDIGYNVLVDRFGTVYEGRYGGIDRNVVGAHALGFNTGSVGVALLGTYTSSPPSQAAQASLVRLLAWRLDLAHIDPLSSRSVISGGSERYPAGLPVLLRVISGHRDTGLTACPGDALYALLDSIAAKTAATGLPKIYAPTATDAGEGQVRFQATLSGSRPWTVTVRDPAGVAVATGTGTGTAVNWTWDAATVAPAVYSWEIATTGATPATGTYTAAGAPAAALAVSTATASPGTISPNGDGQADAASITYTTTAPGSVSITITDASGAAVAQLQPATPVAAGEHTVAFSAVGLPDGAYTVRIDASDGITTSSRTVQVLVTRTLGTVAATPQAFSPNGDGRADRLSISIVLHNAASVKLRILRDSHWVATPVEGQLAAGTRVVRWDGSKRLGRLLDGPYVAAVDVTDAVTTSSVSLPFVSDTRAPTVRVLPSRPLRISVSEPAVLTVRGGGRTVKVRAAAAGTVRILGLGAAAVRVVAWDAAGNASKPVRRSFA
jgi:hypothetical protein